MAAEIYKLLTGCHEIEAVIWFKNGVLFEGSWPEGERPHISVLVGEGYFDTVEEQIEAMAAYCCERRHDDGERLRNHALDLAIGVQPGPWELISLAERQAWILFARTVHQVFTALDVAQAAEKAARSIEEAPPAPGLKREDSIFEETPGLGDLIPGVLEGFAASDAQRIEAERKAKHKEDLAARAARDAEARAAGWETKRMPKPRRAQE